MKYALVNEDRCEAKPDLAGNCPCCGSQVLAKCGAVNIWHWSHKGRRNCDPWWENETEWHRAWKGQFPKEWQEIPQLADGGEKHIADVKTDRGYVIEFQHSAIKPEERQAREDFYKKMLWVVDGTRRLRDKDKFAQEMELECRIDGRQDLLLAQFGGPLKRDWGGRKVPIFFDFGGDTLWGLLPEIAGEQYLSRVERKTLVAALRPPPNSRDSFEALMINWVGTVLANNFRLARQSEGDPLMGLSRSRHSPRRRF